MDMSKEIMKDFRDKYPNADMIKGLLNEREVCTGKISDRGMDSTDRAQ